MVKIRLRRMGAKKQPTYRFVVADDRSPRDGRFIEILGHYNPRTEPKTVVVDQDKARQWLSKGAQPTDPVRRLFAELGLVERGPIPENKRPPKSQAGS
jgi:small subunit ribosomal protein S16